MRNRKLIPCIQGEANLFIKDKALWGLEITNSTQTEEIDFENDAWRHEDQFVISENSSSKTKKLFTFESINQAAGADEELKIAADEEILP